MDLKAYEQINEYEQLLRENNIEIPRLRGIDSCAIMERWTKEEIRINKAWISTHTCEDLCTAKPFWSSNPECYELSEWTDYLKQFYVESCKDSLPKAIRSFFDGSSYEDVVRNAVSLGGDTDTLAAIAGAMAEAFYGIPICIIAEVKAFIPEDMQEVLDRFETILKH